MRLDSGEPSWLGRGNPAPTQLKELLMHDHIFGLFAVIYIIVIVFKPSKAVFEF
jgi:hypothetical protein